MVAEEMDKPLVSGALYRGGFVGRVQRQALTIPHLADQALRPMLRGRRALLGRVVAKRFALIGCISRFAQSFPYLHGVG